MSNQVKAAEIPEPLRAALLELAVAERECKAAYPGVADRKEWGLDAMDDPAVIAYSQATQRRHLARETLLALGERLIAGTAVAA